MPQLRHPTRQKEITDVLARRASAMLKIKHHTLQDVQTFIRKQLPDKLRRDLRTQRIVKEADVECATYYHLRRYIGEDLRWRVLARKHVGIIGRYVDLLIFKNYYPVIALELKWGQLNIGEKDRKSLNGALTELGVNKAYWISVVASPKPHGKLFKERVERNVLHLIIVRLDLGEPERKEWKQCRKRYRSEMALGRGRKKKEPRARRVARTNIHGNPAEA
jgi:hypothetical protein